MIQPMVSTKEKQIGHLYDSFHKKGKRPIRLTLSGVAVVSAMESSINAQDRCSKPIASLAHGSISVIGRRRVMEDAVKVILSFMAAEFSGGYDFFAVCDGHGGTAVSNACRDKLHLLLANEVQEEWAGRGEGLDWQQVISSCFTKMDEETGGGETDEGMAGNTMGSTVVVVMVGREEIVVGNCGDSREVLCRGGVAVPLSRDHKPYRPDERERVEVAGGRVINWNGNRILGVLATSRAIGDHCLKPFVIAEPEVTVCRRTEADEFIVIASDGLWDVVSNNFTCEVVRRCLSGRMKRIYREGFIQSCAAEAAALLAELAMARGSKDNISAMVVQLNTSTQSLVLIFFLLYFLFHFMFNCLLLFESAMPGLV